MVRNNLRSNLLISILFFGVLCTTAFGKMIYVDDDAVGSNDGSSWENAYVYLQDALADANESEKPVDIRVAQGTYTPGQVIGQMPGSREATFQLINGVTLAGGYAGLNIPDPNVDPNERDFEQYETILSGDRFNNDDEHHNRYNIWKLNDNAFHVVTGSWTDNTATLDGFTVTAGYANGPVSGGLFNPDYSKQSGAGMYNESGSPFITNCIFTKNHADNRGGGIDNVESNPTFISCSFIGNSAEKGGGGINNGYSHPNLVKCIFKESSAEYGGGIYNYLSRPTLTNCTFIENSADEDGGGLYNFYFSRPELIYCLFSGNSANNGGGMYNHESTSPPKLNHCIFSGNSATERGGGIYDEDISLTMTNCTLSGNRAFTSGGGIYQLIGSVTFINCIVWGNSNPPLSGHGKLYSTYSNMQIDWWGEGNINNDPCFINPGCWVYYYDPNIIVEPNDPNAVWIDGDYHLKSEAGRWDPISKSWVIDDVTSPCIDAGDPNNPVGEEPDPNGGRINMGAFGGTAEASMSPGAEKIVYVQWLGHSTVKVWMEDCVVYVDPERVPESLHDATLVCVTHTHGDHYSPSDIAKVSNAETQFIGPPDVVQLYGSGQTIAPGQTIEFDFVTVKAVPAYNINKPNHPKSNNWVGYIIEIGGKRVYVAGDTDLIEEMKSLGDIDVAFLPAGGTYTMNATEAAQATGYIKPDLAIPYHWGQNVGTLRDAETFVELAQCPAMVMAVGETISSDKWPEYSPLVAHWALDETDGDIAHDSAGENHGTLYNEPIWQPEGGEIDGALQLDGINDYVSTDFVLDPAKGSFSVFTWIKCDVPGGAVISQTDGAGSGETWLGTDPMLGKLMTGLVPPPAGRSVPQPLVSDTIITDGKWHHVGFAWDGSYRILYVDGTEVARDTAAQNPLKSADGGVYIGVSKTLDVVTFFSGLIDDVRIYNIALTVEEIEGLAL